MAVNPLPVLSCDFIFDSLPFRISHPRSLAEDRLHSNVMPKKRTPETPDRENENSSRSAFLREGFLDAVNDFLAEPPNLPTGHVSDKVLELRSWLELDIVGEICEKNTKYINFILKFINRSEEAKLFPQSMKHWQNAAPTHLLLYSPDGERLHTVKSTHGTGSSADRPKSELKPGDFVSVEFSASLTDDGLLDLGDWAYEVSDFDSINYQYHYGGAYSETKSLNLREA